MAAATPIKLNKNQIEALRFIASGAADDDNTDGRTTRALRNRGLVAKNKYVVTKAGQKVLA